MKFKQIKPGMTLFDVHSHRMGNTMCSTIDAWKVDVLSVDANTRTAVVSWNGNPEEVYSEHSLARLRKHKPLLIRSPMGYNRLATREEIKAAKEKS
jgi:hypothetical protein